MIKYIYGKIYVYSNGIPVEIQTLVLKCDDRSAACVITQQYSSAAFFSLLSDFRNKSSGEIFVVSFSPKLHKIGCACNLDELQAYRGSGVWSPASYPDSQGSIPNQSVCDLWWAECRGIRFCSQ
jgi:hypothetical protein